MRHIKLRHLQTQSIDLMKPHAHFANNFHAVAKKLLPDLFKFFYFRIKIRPKDRPNFGGFLPRLNSTVGCFRISLHSWPAPTPKKIGSQIPGEWRIAVFREEQKVLCFQAWAIMNAKLIEIVGIE